MMTETQEARLIKVGVEIAEGFRMAGGEPSPSYEFTAPEDASWIEEEARALGLNWADASVRREVYLLVGCGYLGRTSEG